MTELSETKPAPEAQPSRLRKLIGLLLLVPFLLTYLLIAMAVGAEFINSRGFLVELVFYVVAGLAWVLPAGLLVTWMQRPDRKAE